MPRQSARRGHQAAIQGNRRNGTRPAMAAPALCLLASMLLPTSGCIHWRDRAATPAVDVMPPVTFPDCTYYGLYPTCWRQWQPGWNCCPPPDSYLHDIPPAEFPVEQLPSPEIEMTPTSPSDTDSFLPEEDAAPFEGAYRGRPNTVRHASHHATGQASPAPGDTGMSLLARLVPHGPGPAPALPPFDGGVGADYGAVMAPSVLEPAPEPWLRQYPAAEADHFGEPLGQP